MRLRGGRKLCFASRYVSFGIGRVFSQLGLPRMQTTKPRPLLLSNPTIPLIHATRQAPLDATKPPNSRRYRAYNCRERSERVRGLSAELHRWAKFTSKSNRGHNHTLTLLLTLFHLSFLSHRQGCPPVVPDHSFLCSLMSSSCT